MLILGLETSCDETSVALVEPAEEAGGRFVVHKNLVSSQIKIHRKYGGVVPEVAARRHVEVIIPLIEDVLSTPSDSPFPRGRMPDVIAVTAGPGLVTSLLVGVETARTLAYLWKKPLVAVNHLEGHIYANWLPVREIPNPKSEIRNNPPAGGQNPKLKKSKILNLKSKIIFPALCLIVSGGHTELILMKDHLKYKLIGQTRDDAAGECFDKVGKMLGLPYPGGPEVAKRADKGNPQAIDFPRPMMDSDDFDFSFSGLKTAALYWLRDNLKTKWVMGYGLRDMGYVICDTGLNDFCASFQQAVVDVLVSKTLRAARKYQVKTILLGGGVASNLSLQKQLAEAIKKEIPNIPASPAGRQYLISNIQYYSDNAAMIAAAAYFHAIKKDPASPAGGFTPWQKLKVKPNWELA